MITFNWTVKSLDVAPTKGAFTDVVDTVHWECVATEGEHTATIAASNKISFDADKTVENFNAFNTLTEEVVLNWLYDAINKFNIEDVLIKKINELKTPLVSVSTLPWSN